MAKSKRAVTEYRSYYLPTHFPVLLLSGDYWKISDIPSGSLHFHNCLEIGICHSDSGTLEINGEKQTFHAGDVTVLPRNVPHTTYSAPGTKSHWSYLFLDPKELFRNLLPASWKNYDLSTDGFPAFRYISARGFPTSTIWYLISSTSWKSRIPAIRSVPEACYAPFILNCTGSKVSAVSIPTRPNRTLLKYWPYRNVKRRRDRRKLSGDLTRSGIY